MACIYQSGLECHVSAEILSFLWVKVFYYFYMLLYYILYISFYCDWKYINISMRNYMHIQISIEEEYE